MADKFELTDTEPTAPSGKVNVKWQSDINGNISAYIEPVPGPPGPEGPSGYSSTVFEFNYVNTTTWPPASGQIRMNTADQTLATRLWPHYISALGKDTRIILLSIRANDLIILQDKDNASRFQEYVATGTPTEQPPESYLEIPVAWQRGGDPVPEQRALLVVRSAGTPGPPGPPGPPAVPAINAQTGTSYTLLTGDNGKVITMSNAAAITLTVPAGLGAGFSVLIIQLGSGKVTVAASGVTIVQRQSFTKTAGQYAVASLLAYAANVFALSGDLGT